ncbi:flavin reductase family protein [Brevibacillus sp. NRS-1366]|uniref:flavin reductase family protein n=1 Tax=Brevibacillus sp. NRS-1366 TaxID=3233899 RepID=UPI003D20B1E5
MDVRALRNAFGKFATGVTIVSFMDGTQIAGITVNSFTSVSIDPPLLLVSIDKKARSHEGLLNKPFIVNVLAAGQEALAWQFAGRPQLDLQIDWEHSTIGPRLAGTLANFECEPWNAYDGGDHTLIVGKVVSFLYRQGDALGFFSGKFHEVATPS